MHAVIQLLTNRAAEQTSRTVTERVDSTVVAKRYPPIVFVAAIGSRQRMSAMFSGGNTIQSSSWQSPEPSPTLIAINESYRPSR